MSRKTLLTICLCLAAFAFFSFKQLQDCTPLTRAQMRQMVQQLGYDVKDLVTDPGKEKFSVNITKDGLNIPIAAEISANEKFIWLTTNLGPADSTNTRRNFLLLKENSKAQPSQFYITSKGNLMLGLPVENKGITNVILREKLESVASKVSDAKLLWQ